MSLITTPLLIDEAGITDNYIENKYIVGPIFQWSGLLVIGFCANRVACWCGLPTDCMAVDFVDVEYLLVYGCAAGLIINILDDKRNYIINRCCSASFIPGTLGSIVPASSPLETRDIFVRLLNFVRELRRW